jgi:PhoH-like ATPase
MADTVLVDTNVLLDNSNILYKLSKEYKKILIPLTVLKELDKHKYNRDLSYSARTAIHSIRDFKDKFPEKLIFSLSSEEINDNDSKIINAALKEGADIATKDISMKIIAESQNLNAKLFDVVLNNLFKPYIFIDIDMIQTELSTFSLSNTIIKEEYERFIEFLNKHHDQTVRKDAWFFVFIQDKMEKPLIYANHPYYESMERIDNKQKYLQLETTNTRKIKAQDIFQICAIYALKEAPNVLITGVWGSGKTLLSTAYALENKLKKVFITRPPIGIDSKYDIGFFPGDKEDKMMDWLSGFTSSLYYIYGNTNGQYGYDYVKDTIFQEVFEVIPINSIQGMSLLDRDIMMVDEIQLTNIDLLSMILSRPSKTGKLVLIGDLKQTYNIVKPSESGLLKLLRVLPHRSIAYVELQNSHRSELLEVAVKLQDKIFG